MADLTRTVPAINSATSQLCWLYLQARRSKDPAELRALSFSDSEQIRRAVATNTFTPGDVVDDLCWDWCPAVRSTAALNPNAGYRALSRLADDQNNAVRLSVAYALCKHSELLRKLADDSDSKIRSVARSALERPSSTVLPAAANVTFAQFGRAA